MACHLGFRVGAATLEPRNDSGTNVNDACLVPLERTRASVYPWVAAFGLVALFGATLAIRLETGRGLPGIEILIIGAFVGWGFLGCLLVSRVPTHAEGWLLAGAGALTVFGFLLEAVGSGPGTAENAFRSWAAWLESWLTDSGMPVLVILVILYFPQGRLRTRLERSVLVLSVVMGAIAALTIALKPGSLPGHNFENPAGVAAFDGLATALTAVLVDGPLLAVAFLLALGTLAIRARRARGDERQQVKWFVYAVAGVVITVVLGSLSTSIGIASPTFDALGGILFALAIMALPLAITIAVLRYRLYDIDVIVNKTLVYVILTAVLAGTYAIAIVVLQQLLRPFGSGSDVTVAASTLAVAGLFGPVRNRVQRFIDKRFYRRRYDAERVLDNFASELRNEVDLASVVAKLSGVIHDVIQPTHVSLWTAPHHDRVAGTHRS